MKKQAKAKMEANQAVDPEYKYLNAMNMLERQYRAKHDQNPNTVEISPETFKLLLKDISDFKGHKILGASQINGLKIYMNDTLETGIIRVGYEKDQKTKPGPVRDGDDIYCYKPNLNAGKVEDRTECVGMTTDQICDDKECWLADAKRNTAPSGPDEAE